MSLLDGILVLDFSQYLAGPSASLRLADLGARVIKVERKGVGDGSRSMTLKNLTADGDSVLFHTINRNKESFCADFKSGDDLNRLKALIAKADVMIENFRPRVMQRYGLDYASVKDINPKIVYGTVTGYTNVGTWASKPGQDLLVQSMSGLAWLNGDRDQPPTPFALSVADSYAGVHLAQGIMACLFRRFRTNLGGLVEVSLMESALDMQFEGITTYLNNGKTLPERSGFQNAHAYLSAPYGIYQTKDGYIALAMGSVADLGDYLGIPELEVYSDPDSWFTQRDEIKELIQKALQCNTTDWWLSVLESKGYWCSPVYNWNDLTESEHFQGLQFTQTTGRPDGKVLTTTRCPMTVNGRILSSKKWAPALGEHTESIIEEFQLELSERSKP